MAKAPKSQQAEIHDEPGAEDRFMRGIRKALKTPHKPHKEKIKVGKRAPSEKGK